jgi:hypothetical protein
MTDAYPLEQDPGTIPVSGATICWVLDLITDELEATRNPLLTGLLERAKDDIERLTLSKHADASQIE